MQWIFMKDVDEIRDFNEKLIRSEATIYQFPYWNDSLNFPAFRPRYLKCVESGELLGYLSFFEIGIRGLRFCTINHGPIRFGNSESKLFWTSLMELLKKHYSFARFAPKSNEDLHLLKSLDYQMEEINSFPFYTPLKVCLLVEQTADEETTLQKFGETARRLIRKAERVGYEIRSTKTLESFQEAWPLYQKLAERKGFSFRPLKSYLRLIQEGAGPDLVRVFNAYHDKNLVESIFITMDGKMAWYMSGALDTTKIYQNASPSFCLHFKAMRELYREKALSLYNLGARSGKVFEFKSRFHPTAFTYPDSVTVIFNPILYKVYSNSVLKFKAKIKGRIKKLLG